MQKYINNYEIRSYECDVRGNLRLQTLFNLFQDMADTHAHMLGIGYDYCISNGLLWVGTNYVIEISRLPKWGETLTIKTWPSEKSLVCGIRDFEVLAGDEIIIRAASRWALLDAKKLRPVSIQKYAPHEPLYERAIATDFPKIQVPEIFDFEKKFAVNYSDIDVNHHVNNSVYPLWAENAMPVDFRLTHNISEIEVAFKKSATIKDEILVQTTITDDLSLQQIKSVENGQVFAHIKTKWQKK